MAREIPLVLIFEILLFLPVKSLLSLKFVCKDWFNLINNPIFIKLHLHKSKLNPNSKSKSSLAFLNPEDCLLYFIDHSGSVYASQPAELTISLPFTIRNLELIGSCNGLLCFYGSSFHEFVCVSNPLTRTFKDVSIPLGLLSGRNFDIEPAELIFGFGYDCEKDDYVIIVMDLSGKNTVDYSFKRDSWKISKSLAESMSNLELIVSLCGLLTNERLHWIVETKDRCRIARFNLGTREWDELSSEFIANGPIRGNYNLASVNGYVCVCSTISYPRIINVWIMKEYGVEESWTKLASFECYRQEIGCLISNLVAYLESTSKLIFRTYNHTSLFSYDLEEKTFTKVELGLQIKVIGDCQFIPYVESLVFVPQSLVGL